MAEKPRQTSPTKLQATTMTVTDDALSSATFLFPDSRPISSLGHRHHNNPVRPMSQNNLSSPSNSDNKLSAVHFSQTVSVRGENPALESTTVVRKRDKAKSAGKTGAKAVGHVLLGILGCVCFVLGKACILDGGGGTASRAVVYADSAEKAEEIRRRRAILEMERRQYEREMMYRKPGPKPRSRATSQVQIDGAVESHPQQRHYLEQGEGPRRRLAPPERRSTGTIAVKRGRPGVGDERRQIDTRRTYRSAER